MEIQTLTHHHGAGVRTDVYVKNVMDKNQQCAQIIAGKVDVHVAVKALELFIEKG